MTNDPRCGIIKAQQGSPPRKRKEKEMKIIKKIWDTILFVFTGKGDAANEMIEAGLIDYSGQGRDKYGK